MLLDLPILEQHVLGLVWRGGRIDHPNEEHDDHANKELEPMAKLNATETSDPILKEKAEREAREYAEAEAAAVQRRADLLAWAEGVVEKVTPADVLKMVEQRKGVDALYSAEALALEKAEAAVADTEREFASRRAGPGDIYTTGVYRDKLKPLHDAVAEAKARSSACREVARARVEASLRTLIDIQVPQVVEHLKKALGPDERIRTYEAAVEHFNIPRFGSRSFGIAKLLRGREGTTS